MQQSNNPVSPKDLVLDKTVADENIGTKLAIKYPNSWTLANSSSLNNPTGWDSESHTITSPDKEVSVEFHAWVNSGLGATYPAGATYQKLDDDFKIDGAPLYGFTTYVVRSNQNNQGDRYQYFSGVYGVPSYTSAGVTLAMLDKNQYIGQTEANNNVATLKIKFNKLDKKKDLTPDDVSSAIATDNYKVAKSIVKSLHYKSE